MLKEKEKNLKRQYFEKWQHQLSYGHFNCTMLLPIVMSPARLQFRKSNRPYIGQEAVVIPHIDPGDKEHEIFDQNT